MRLGKICSIGAVIYCALIFVSGPALAADPDIRALAPWLEAIRACAARPTLKLAVIGFDRSDRALAADEAEAVRLGVESLLHGDASIHLTSAADVTRIKAMREGTTGLSDAEAEAQIRAAFDGDATIFFVGPTRRDGAVRFRLQAITRKADCKATSETIEIALATRPGLSDAGAVMKSAVSRLLDAAPGLRVVEAPPFSAGAGHSACALALQDLLMVALDAAAHDPNRVLSGKSLAARKVAQASKGAPDLASARGQFDLDNENQGFMTLEFVREGSTIAPTGRVAIALGPLACDPTIRPFLDHVAATAKTDRTRLEISAPVYAVGQRLDVAINTQKPLHLYCWLLAPDETAYVLLPPTREGAASIAAGARRYPRDFGLSEVVLDSAFDNQFVCYGSEARLPPALEANWRGFAATAEQPAKLIEKAELQKLMQQMRAAPGIVEATARIVTR